MKLGDVVKVNYWVFKDKDKQSEEVFGTYIGNVTSKDDKLSAREYICVLLPTGVILTLSHKDIEVIEDEEHA